MKIVLHQDEFSEFVGFPRNKLLVFRVIIHAMEAFLLPLDKSLRRRFVIHELADDCF